MAGFYKPDEHRLHTFEVNEVEGPLKTFRSKDGEKEKYLIKFKDHGYEAEFCPLIGTFSSFKIEPGKRLCFRIVYRKEYRDEIEPATVAEQETDAPQARAYSMVGHPANLALKAATDFNVAKVGKSKEGTIKVSDLLADADSIYDWLTKKGAGEE